ncbi:MAG: hypothetical protein GEU98_28900 [Pseudonocardiaceae bacterium]|nr:hypothetical protein [Pseudonocardiaceae bacterium]
MPSGERTRRPPWPWTARCPRSVRRSHPVRPARMPAPERCHRPVPWNPRRSSRVWSRRSPRPRLPCGRYVR